MTAPIAVVVVNYASSALLADNLVATCAAVPEASVVVCDNHSTAAEAAQLAELAGLHGWTVIYSPTNLGFGGGVNAAAGRAFANGAQEVLLLNPDARIDGPSMAALRAATAADRLTLAAPVIRTSTGKVWFDGADLYLDRGETRGRSHRAEHPGAEAIQWISGACMLLTREVFEATGGFDPEYFLYWEDVDLSWRAAKVGVKLVVVAEASAVHDAGGTQERTGRRGKSRVYYFYNARNRLLFAARHLDPQAVRRWLRATPGASYRILLRGGRAQLLSDPGLLWAVLKGSWAGIRLARAALTRPPARPR